MQAFNLRFAPANSFRQRQIYLKLYGMLAEQVNGSGSIGSSSVALGNAVKSGAESAAGAGRQAISSAENLGGKAISGLKSAATDFFKEMDWSHLSGKPTAK